VSIVSFVALAGGLERYLTTPDIGVRGVVWGFSIVWPKEFCWSLRRQENSWEEYSLGSSAFSLH
jgi:hypothetical protein